MRRPTLLLAFLVLSGSTALSCGGGSGAGGGGAYSETWTGTFTGTALGAFVCLSGTDGWYDEAGTVAFSVQGKGLAAMLQDTTVYDLSGTYSDGETAHEASGFGCAPAPSVVSDAVPSTSVAIKKVMAQLQVSSSSVLMPAHFRYSSSTDALDSQKLLLDAQSIAADQVTGTWQAQPSAGTRAALANGTFVLTRTSVTGGPPPAPVDVKATGGGSSGKVTLSWSASAGASSYKVYGGASSPLAPGATTPAAGSLLGSTSGTSFTAGGLADGTAYYFVVTAVGSAGEGAPSAVVSATPGAAGSGEVFVAGGGVVRVYDRNASGSAAPLRTLSGAATLLGQPSGVSVDATDGEVVVADYPNVLVFDRTAGGNTAPLRTFVGNGTMVRADPVNQEIAVADGGSVRFYARNATGSAAPLRTLQVLPAGGGTLVAYDLVIDAVHDEILAVTGISTAAPLQVSVFARTATGSATPLRTFTAFPSQATTTAGLAVDPAQGEVWVTNDTAYPTTATAAFSRTATGTPAALRQSPGYGMAMYLDATHGEVGLLDPDGKGYTVLSATTLATLRAVSWTFTLNVGHAAIDVAP